MLTRIQQITAKKANLTYVSQGIFTIKMQDSRGFFFNIPRKSFWRLAKHKPRVYINDENANVLCNIMQYEFSRLVGGTIYYYDKHNVLMKKNARALYEYVTAGIRSPKGVKVKVQDMTEDEHILWLSNQGVYVERLTNYVLDEIQHKLLWKISYKNRTEIRFLLPEKISHL